MKSLGKNESVKAGLLILLSVVIIASVLIISIVERQRQNQLAELPGDPDNLIGFEEILEPIPPQINANEPKQEAPVSAETPVKTEAAPPIEEKDDAIETAVIDLTKLQNPVESSSIVMAYSYNEDPVFSKTFNEYRSDHTGIDISAKMSENVRAAYDGKIIEVRNDPKLGTLIRIDHGNNTFTEYGNLDGEVNVSVGDEVKTGDVIGIVGKTAQYEIAEGIHLHFALQVKGDYVNPASYLKLN